MFVSRYFSISEILFHPRAGRTHAWKCVLVFSFSWFSRLSPVSWLSGSHSLSSLLRFPSAPGMGPAAKRTRHKLMKGISTTPGQPTRLPVGMSDVLKSGNYLFSPRLIHIYSTGGSQSSLSWETSQHYAPEPWGQSHIEWCVARYKFCVPDKS